MKGDLQGAAVADTIGTHLSVLIERCRCWGLEVCPLVDESVNSEVVCVVGKEVLPWPSLWGGVFSCPLLPLYLCVCVLNGEMEQQCSLCGSLWSSVVVCLVTS